ncbi:MAG: long-chain fatty acid--CoA ligase [Treponema sp.]|jgi:long-chain acyl-CoA synthetase|nr:long-chain fatty acid--CoA ligase [Treponema sp.]
MKDTIQTLGDLCLEGARRFKSRKALDFCRGDRLLETVNFRTLALRAGQLAALFQSLGVRRGDRILILSENRPEWPTAIFGAALAGAVSVPVSAPGNPPSGLAALCVTRRTAAAATAPHVPRIYLDSGWRQPAGIQVSVGGVMKQLPLAGGNIKTGGTGADDPAILWPDGGQSSHGELLSLAAGAPRLYPRDRILPLCPLAEKGALILAVLAAVRGGASLSCVEGSRGDAEPAELLRAAELLRPTVLAGESSFLEALFSRDTQAERFLSGNSFTRPLARSLANRRIIKALGGNVRYYGVTAGPPPGRKLGGQIKYIGPI